MNVSLDIILICSGFLVFFGLVCFFFLFVKFEKMTQKNKFLEQERNDLLDSLDKTQFFHAQEKETQKKLLQEKEARDEEREKNREHAFFEKIEKLENSREKFEQEQLRIQKKEETLQKKREENFSKIWNEHENIVISEIKKICQMRECGFIVYSNTTLPSEFSGNLKPDTMISFLDQYIVFDAKKSKNPKQYIDSQVKVSAMKYKNSENSESIYSTVFFVMPEDEISQLEKRYFYEEGYSFFIISVSALLPTLMMLKKITEYANILDFDPEDREAIVNTLAQYDSHISFQNAVNIVLARKSQELMDSKKSLPDDFQKEIQARKNTMKDFRLNPSEIKKHVQSSSSILPRPLHSSS